MTPEIRPEEAFTERPPRLPFIERPWLLLLTVALVLGIGGQLVWHAGGRGEAGELIDLMVSIYLAVGVLIAPTLSQRAARKAMRRLPRPARLKLIARLTFTAIAGPCATVALWVGVFDGPSLGARLPMPGWPTPAVTVMALCSGLIALAGVAGFAMQERFRR